MKHIILLGKILLTSICVISFMVALLAFAVTFHIGTGFLFSLERTMPQSLQQRLSQVPVLNATFQDMQGISGQTIQEQTIAPIPEDLKLKNIAVSNKAQVQKDLTVGGNGTFGGNLSISKDTAIGGKLQVNGNLVIGGTTTFAQGIDLNNTNLNLGIGSVTAGNVLYGLTAGNGVTVGSGQIPTITNNGVLSLQNQTGNLSLTAGSGIYINGLIIQNTDLGSSQNIFKNITVSGQSTLIAGSNNDTLNFAAGSGISLATNGNPNTVTITATSNGSGSNGWTHISGNTYVTNTTDNVGIGTTSPTSLLDVAGTASLSGNMTFRALSSIQVLNGLAFSVVGSPGGDAGLSPSTPLLYAGSNGNIGIGTNAPSEKLQLTGGNLLLDNNQFLEFKDSGGASRGVLQLTSSNNLKIIDSATSGSIQIGLSNASNTNGRIQFFTQNLTERMRLDANGNLGIGTTTPTVALDVVGSASTSGNLTFRGGGAQQVNLLNNSTLGFYNSANGDAGLGANPALYIGANGNVGVGNSTAIEKLQITAGNLLVDNNQFLEFKDSGGASRGVLQLTSSNNLKLIDGATSGSIQIGLSNASNSTGSLQFFTQGLTERMRVDPSGNLGINTTSPLATLDVRSTSGTTPIASLSGNTASAGLVVDNSGTGDIITASNSGATRFRIDNAGNLTVAGNTIFNGQTYTWPSNLQSNGYALTTNGSGLLSWSLPSAGSVAFSGITGGTNTTAAMVIGAGSSLTYSGGTTTSGVINANQLLGGTWAIPGTIGSSTPNSGAFTTLSANSTGNVLTLSGNGANIAFTGTSGINQITTASNQNFSIMPNGTGNVGIGTTGPGYKLTVASGSNTGTTGALNTTTTFTNTAANTYIDNLLSTTIGLSGNEAGATNHTGTKVLVQTGNDSNTYNAGSQIRSLQLTALHQGTQTLPSMKGIFLDTENTNTGTVSAMYGSLSLPRNTSTGTISNLYGYYMQNPINSGGGTISNAYGLYVENMTTATTAYGIYVAGNQSYLGGATGIGTTAIGNGELVVSQPNSSGNILSASQSGTTVFNIDNSGNTRITASLCVKATFSTACAGNTAGTIYASNTTVQAADVAENYVSSQSLEPGDVIMPASDGDNQAVVRTTSAYQSQTIGIVSTNPGVTLNSDAITDNKHPNKYPIALQGRVPVKVASINGNITVGDLLTSSSIPGVAQKATQAGQIIGKALDNYSSSDPHAIGKIMVFVNISWTDPTVTLTADGNLSVNGQPIDTTASPNVLSASSQISPTSSITSDQFNNLSSTVLDLQGKIASMSSQLGKIDDLSKQLEDLQKTVNLNQLLSGTGTQSAVLGASTSLTDDTTIGGKLNVLGRTVLSDIGVTGTINTGLLTINGMDMSSGTASATINTLTSPLKFQSLAVAGIDLENGKVTIDTNGNLVTKGDITAKKIHADEADLNKLNLIDSGDSASVGEATIPAGQTSIEVKTKAVTNKSNIFTSPEEAIDFSIGIIDQKQGVSFTAKITKPAVNDMKFKWWILN